MFTKHEPVGRLWVLTDKTQDSGWETLVCEAHKKRNAPNFNKPRWDLSRWYDSEEAAIAGHNSIISTLQA